MKSLQNCNVKELNSHEMKETNGGFIQWVFGFLAIAAIAIIAKKKEQ